MTGRNAEDRGIGIDPPLPVMTRAARAWGLLINACYDVACYWRHSFIRGARSRENLRARIGIGLHFLEYSMSLPDSAPGRAVDRARALADDLRLYAERYGADATTAMASKTLLGWLDFNAGRAADLQDIAAIADEVCALGDSGLRGGTERVTAESIRQHGMVDFLSFARARHSIRQYAAGQVPIAAIRQAVAVAQQSPSSCNRQTCRLWIWTEPEACARILAHQSGNRGFGHQLGGVAIVTSDLCHWENAAERYQAWVDGGMFAMSFVYGLHAEGLGSVMLNWSVERDQDRRLRRAAGLPDSARIITLIGFGLLPHDLPVPVSQRPRPEAAMTLNRPLPAPR